MRMRWIRNSWAQDDEEIKRNARESGSDSWDSVLTRRSEWRAFSALWSQSLHAKTVFPRSYILCLLCDKDHAEWFISIRSLNFDDNPKHWTCDSIVLHGCGDPGIGSECTGEGHMDRRRLSQDSVSIKLTLDCGDNYWIVPSVRSTEAMFGWICPDLTSSLKRLYIISQPFHSSQWLHSFPSSIIYFIM